MGTTTMEYKSESITILGYSETDATEVATDATDTTEYSTSTPITTEDFTEATTDTSAPDGQSPKAKLTIRCNTIYCKNLHVRRTCTYYDVWHALELSQER